MGKLLVVVGYAESGKRTLVREIIRQHPGAVLVKSTTTRKPREHDLDDHYEHVTMIDFTLKLWSGFFLWHTSHRGHGNIWHRFGTARGAIEEILETDNALGVILLVPEVVVDLAHFLEGKGHAKNFIPIFLRAPEPKEHIRRLKKRHASDAVITRCLNEAKHWQLEADAAVVDYHYVVNTGKSAEVARCVLRELKLTESK